MKSLNNFQSIYFSLVLGFCLVSCVSKPVLEDDETWDSVYKQAKVLEFAGEFDQATRSFEQSLKLIPDDRKKSFYETDITARITKILVNNGSVEKAKPLVAKILLYKGNSEVSTKEQSELLVLFDDLSDLYLHKAIKNDKNYLYCLNTSLRLITLSESRIKRRSIKIYSLLASYYIDHNQFERGLKMFDIALGVLDEDRSNINDDLEGLLYVYISLKNKNLDKQANQVMGRLIRVYKGKNGNDLKEQLPYYMYGKLGIAYSELNQYGKAREAFDKAIKLARAKGGVDSTTISEMQVEVALACENLKLYKEADRAFKQAIKTQKTRKDKSGYRLIAKRLDAYAKYLERRKDFERARVTEKEAIELKSRYFKTLGANRKR